MCPKLKYVYIRQANKIFNSSQENILLNWSRQLYNLYFNRLNPLASIFRQCCFCIYVFESILISWKKKVFRQFLPRDYFRTLLFRKWTALQMLEFQSSLGHAQFVTLVLVLGTQEYVLIHIRSAVKELRTGLTLSPHATSRPPHISKIMSPFNKMAFFQKCI